ncbi:MAG TPA: hypothetical protein VIV58_37045, partial [Kofleriaceae bacterium]
ARRDLELKAVMATVVMLVMRERIAGAEDRDVIVRPAVADVASPLAPVAALCRETERDDDQQ